MLESVDKNELRSNEQRYYDVCQSQIDQQIVRGGPVEKNSFVTGQNEIFSNTGFYINSSQFA